MNALDKLLSWQPLATDVRKIGKCPDCKNGSELFYSLPEYDTDRIQDGWISGGSYCPECGFSNSCRVPLAVYENAKILKGADNGDA